MKLRSNLLLSALLALGMAAQADVPVASTPEEAVRSYYAALAKCSTYSDALALFDVDKQHSEVVQSRLQLTFSGDTPIKGCLSNLKNLATSLEMYSTDNAGRYPRNLSPLTPNYLIKLPVCPVAGSNTYSASYQVTANPDTYTVSCTGHHHANMDQPVDYPKYSSNTGVVMMPLEHMPKMKGVKIEKVDIPAEHADSARVTVKETFLPNPELPQQDADVVFQLVKSPLGWQVHRMDMDQPKWEALRAQLLDMRSSKLGDSLSPITKSQHDVLAGMGVSERVFGYSLLALDTEVELYEKLGAQLTTVQRQMNELERLSRYAYRMYLKDGSWPTGAAVAQKYKDDWSRSAEPFTLNLSADKRRAEFFFSTPGDAKLGVAPNYPRFYVDAKGWSYGKLHP